MSLTVNKIISEIQESLGVDDDDSGFDATSVLSFLNRAYDEIDNEIKFKSQEATYSFTIVAGTRTFDVSGITGPSLVSIENISVIDPDSFQSTPLIRMTQVEYQSRYNTQTSARGKPTHYYRDGDDLFMWPTPDLEYDMVLHFVGKLASLIIGTSYPDMPAEWHEVLYFGGLWRGHIKQQQYNKAGVIAALYEQKKQQLKPVEVKEEADSRFAGVKVLKRPYLRK